MSQFSDVYCKYHIYGHSYGTFEGLGSKSKRILNSTFCQPGFLMLLFKEKVFAQQAYSAISKLHIPQEILNFG